MDRGRAQDVLIGVAEGGERGLEGDIKEFREDTYADTGG